MVPLYPHQKNAVDELKNGNVLWGGVGSGKSRTAIAYYMKQESDKDIYVITTAKKRDSLDWDGECARFGIGKEQDATVAGVLTIDSWNNIGKYIDVDNAFFIFDEQRLVGSGAWTKAFYKIAMKNNWIVLSATPGDTWMDYVPVFIANGFYKNRTAFQREHVVYNTYAKFPKIDRYTSTGRLLRHRKDILVYMPYQSLAEANHHEISVMHDVSAYNRVLKDRWNVVEDRPIANMGEFFFALRRIVYSDPSRTRALLDVMDLHPKLIVFYTFNYELDILREVGANSEVQFAEWNGHKHESIPDSDSWVYLVQYTSGAEGWNCIETNAICFYSLTYSYKTFKQAQGRIDRLDTKWKKINYYSLVSSASIDVAVLRALSKKQNFNESIFIK